MSDDRSANASLSYETSSVRVSDIVQAVPGTCQWAPALVVVSEIKSWGVQGYTSVPLGGEAYIRLTWEQIEPTGGRAVFVPAPHETEGSGK